MILIAFYLWKDIWRQWLTNPISFVARVAVSSFLFLIALGIGVYFKAVEDSLSRELEGMGLGRVMLTQFVYGERLADISGGLDQRLAGLKEDGAYVYFRRVPYQAEIEILGKTPILTYRDKDLVDLKHFLPAVDGMSGYLITRSEIPSGSIIGGWVRGLDLRFKAVRADDLDLEQLGDQSFVLIPAHWVPWLEETGYVEMILFEADASDLNRIGEILRKIQLFLRLDRYDEVSLQSSANLLERLEKLREQQAFWSWAITVVVSALIVLVFASTAFLEYRQNIYLSALLQSLGVSRAFIYVRYFIELLLLLILGLSLALGVLLATLHYGNLPAALQNVDFTTLFYLRAVIVQWGPVLLVTTLLGTLPVCIGLRKEVGRLLQ